MRTFRFDKLVRDKIVPTMEREGSVVKWHKLDDDDYVLELVKKLEEELNTLHDELSVLEKRLKSRDSITDEERLFYIRDFWKQMQNSTNMTDLELNKCYKDIIESIIWTRKDNSSPIIEINFL